MSPADPTADTGTAVTTTADVGFHAEPGLGSGPHADARPDIEMDSDADVGPASDTGSLAEHEAEADPTPDGHGGEDTMDLHLPDELLAFIAEGTTEPAHHEAECRAQELASLPAADFDSASASDSSSLPVTTSRTTSGLPYDRFPHEDLPYDDLLDGVGDWGPTDTPAGVFHLVPVRVERDLPLISRWMNDPAAAAFWELSGPQDVTEHHLRDQLGGDGRSVPCIGVLDGKPMSYWEIYRADLDPLARHYPARPHDTGVHLLVGAVADRGRGLGGLLLRAVADLVLARRPSCGRVIAEPDMRNTPSIAAFLTAGFRFSAEVDLPAKRAALMVRDRSLRRLM
ncbi:GNAT family N-acetyltransferase [Streptomyces sp. bgisy032]|uniref:GNAT family N-acetyltransferase n=1 Tax=Streptomyces sp. bgisy032 TaxID=3413773 RepID=UPI003D703582